MCLFDSHQTSVRGHSLGPDPIPAENFVQVQTVNTAKGIQTIDRRQSTLIFDVGEPADQNREFRIIVPLGDLLAGNLHIPKPEAQPFPCAAQPLSSQFHLSRSSPASPVRSVVSRRGAQGEL